MDFKSDLSSFETKIFSRAKKLKKTIVLPEASLNDDIVKAAINCANNKIAKIVLLVSNNNVQTKFKIKTNDYLKIENYLTSELKPMLSSALYVKRKEKGLTEEQAQELIKNPVYFATMMVDLGLVDGMVCGSVYTSADSLRPALQIIKGKTKESLISSYFIVISDNKKFGKNGVLLLSDCGLNMNPTKENLVDICFDTVNSARKIANIEPKVALLSYSTLGSAEGETSLKMREATKLIKERKPDFVVDGEFQFDAAVNANVAKRKAPNSEVKGDANVLIFPNLESGNIAYKIIQRFADFKVIGPLCQGFKKPVNDLSRGADEQEILRAIAITALQCDL